MGFFKIKPKEIELFLPNEIVELQKQERFRGIEIEDFLQIYN